MTTTTPSTAGNASHRLVGEATCSVCGATSDRCYEPLEVALACPQCGEEMLGGSKAAGTEACPSCGADIRAAVAEPECSTLICADCLQEANSGSLLA